MSDLASEIGKKPAQIALAWLSNKPEITAPVVGVSKVQQLEDLIEATEIKLTEDQVGYLEELYEPIENLLTFGTS